MLISPTTVPAGKTSPREKAVRSVRLWIQQGILPVGQKLPAEHVLAAKLDISRPTVHSALQELESLGFLKPHRRRGYTVVGNQAPRNALLAATVAILTEKPDQTLESWQRQRGWGAVVQQGTVEAIAKAGLHALSLHPDRLGEELLQQFIIEGPVGVVALRPAPHSNNMQTLVSLRDSGVPVVVYGDVRNTDTFDSVSSDHEAGSYNLTRWLIAQGRRRILRVWTARWDTPSERPAWLARRDAGHERAVREAGLETLPPLEFRGTDRSTTRTTAEFELSTHLMVGYLWKYLLGEQPIDAIMTISDGGAYSAAAACRILGKQPGRDVLLAGYDNYWADAPERQWENSQPAATMDKLNLDIGKSLVDLLLQRRQAPPGTPAMHRLVEPQLVVVDESRAGESHSPS